MSESTPASAPRWWVLALCAVAGLAWGTYLIGPSTIDPTSVSWMMRDDWAPPLFGWLYSRSAPWGLPLGQAPGYLHPIGTSLAYTDATPWLSTFFKLLSPWLPTVFQVHGPWLALCFALQGFFGARIAACFTPRPLLQLLSGTLFVLSPALNSRLSHVSLCAHWLVLVFLWLYLRPCPDARTATRTLTLATFFIALSAGVHVYLAVMNLLLALSLTVRLWLLDEHLSARRAVAWAIGMPMVALGIMALFGFFSGVTTEAFGYNYFSSNLLTFIDPAGLSRFLPAFPIGRRQYEGIAYLGLGVLGLGAIAGGALLVRRKEGPLLPRRLWPLVAACLLLALFAFSARIQLAQVTVFSYERLYEVTFEPLGKIFRAPGRFIWPLHYALIVGAVAALLRLLRHHPRAAAGALGLALALQALEVPDDLRGGARFEPQSLEIPGGNAFWSLATGHYRHVVLYPPVMVDGTGHGCPPDHTFSTEESLPFAWQAWQAGMTFNAGYVARVNEQRTLAYCQELERDMRQGRLDPATLYVIHGSVAARFQEDTAGRATCGSLDGVLVCVAAGRGNALSEALK
ncbi:hypothetical protein F0U61_41475 [Archangium violaceum]|uniref:DUF6311 domain-containing protein n=1 Tax=Archangium violaceum TaxID=83451 RepID=UPI002B286493|nr:hypothetical protein F0U61_41475 [Archangium violaceum]